MTDITNIPTPTTFAELVTAFLLLIEYLVYFVFALTLAFVVFVVINSWVIKGGDEKAVADGKQYIIAAIVGLVVMSGIWGILRLLRAGLLGT